jgi:uncharacterized protein YkwD
MSPDPIGSPIEARRSAARVLAACFLAFAASGQAPAPPAKPTRADKASAALIRRALVEHNQVRASEKLPPLEIEPRLNAAALAHAEDMARNETMTHDGSDGSHPAERMARQGYRFRSTGENVAMGQATVKAVMRAWMNSPPHKKNILGSYTQAGIAMVRSEDGVPFWCVEFGTPWPELDPARARTGVVEELNRARQKKDLEPLVAEPKLDTAATKIAERLARAATLDQEKSRGPTFAQSLLDSGYRYRSVAQLLASGLATPAELVSHLTEGAANRAACLGPFEHVGIGVATTSEGVPYWCVILARPFRE